MSTRQTSPPSFNPKTTSSSERTSYKYTLPTQARGPGYSRSFPSSSVIMSEYPYRTYSPGAGGANRSPTRRTAPPIIPPAGTYPSEWNRQVNAMPGFEGWRADDDVPSAYASTPNIVPEVVPKTSASASSSFISSQSAPPYDHIPPSLLPGGAARGSRTSLYSTATSDRGESPYRRRHVRTPSTSSTESASRSRDRRPGRSNRDRTPSTSPTRAIPRDGVSASSTTFRTPSGNIMTSLFTSENAAAVGSALGSAASFLGARAGLTNTNNNNNQQHLDDDRDGVPGGYNSRPVPDTANNAGGGFNLNDAIGYLSSHLGAPQDQATPPPQQQQGGSPFTLSNALNYLGSQQGRPAGSSGGLPGNFQLAGIDIDFKWLAQKAGEQNPWVLLGAAVVAFWIISSIIATLMWYGIVAGVLYVIYVVGVKNGGFEALSAGNRPPQRRVGGPGSTGGGGGWTYRRPPTTQGLREPPRFSSPGLPVGPSSDQENTTLLPCLSRSSSQSSPYLTLPCSSSRSGLKESGSRRGSSHHDSKDKSFSHASSFSNCSDFSALGDIIDYNFHDLVSVDSFVSTSFDFSSSSSAPNSTSNFDFVGGGGGLDGSSIDSFLDFGSVDTSSSCSSSADHTTATTTPSPHLPAASTSTPSLSVSPLQNVTVDMISNGDLDSLLSIHPHLQLNDYTMGLPLFSTPTPPNLTTSPVQDSSPIASSGSPSTASPGSCTTLPPSQFSTPSLPPLNTGYRIQKPKPAKSKPGPKPKAKLPSASPPLEYGGEGLDFDGEDSPAMIDKRYRNNLAAKKYRQKKVDRISELEGALADMTRERDELRLRLARKEAEGQVLREVMARGGKGSS
ncbi:hypothetical protein H072_9461 [Dactylellina haptotyla CBS 200.50]|uniref:BZIP domain-containing protein n=1 Tax=Dactylellina haptotyla (strain CBS 200.50) TaxID=1284197 RepID=S8A751_DACHA|nr:hypothetical protein H072_9461 [Dactylellina haptotyla CBS 200.50]